MYELGNWLNKTFNYIEDIGGVRELSLTEDFSFEQTIDDRKLFRQRLISAVEFGKTLPQVDDTKIAMIGFCFGGLAAIELARSGINISGCVSFHGLLNLCLWWEFHFCIGL